MHNGNIYGDDLGFSDTPTFCTETPTILMTHQIRMQILKNIPTVPIGTPMLFGDGTPASIIALALYGEQSPCLPQEFHSAMFQHCA